jgi:hypothetical protein
MPVAVEVAGCDRGVVPHARPAGPDREQRRRPEPAGAVAEEDRDIEVCNRDGRVKVPVAGEVAEHDRPRMLAGGVVRRPREAAAAVAEEN